MPRWRSALPPCSARAGKRRTSCRRRSSRRTPPWIASSPGAPFRSWLLRIVANETHNLHRASGRRMARERRAWEQSQPLLLARSHDPADATVATDRRSALVQGLARLSPEHRQVVTCRYLLDLDEVETATVLGWPRGTVKSRLHRAVARLRDVLDTEESRDRTREVKHG